MTGLIIGQTNFCWPFHCSALTNRSVTEKQNKQTNKKDEFFQLQRQTKEEYDFSGAAICISISADAGPYTMCDLGIKYFVNLILVHERFVFIISNKAIVYIYRSLVGNYCWPQVQAPMRRKVHSFLLCEREYCCRFISYAIISFPLW